MSPAENQTGFRMTVWKKLRPQAIGAAVEFGDYLIIWIGVLAAHFIKVMGALCGVEPEIIKVVSFIEKWVWIATFAAYFWRVLTRVIRGVRGSKK